MTESKQRLTQADELAVELLDINLKIEQLNDRKAQIQDALRSLGAGKHATGRALITVSEPIRRFDPKLAVELLNPELLQLCQETKLSGSLAKKNLPPTLYEKCQKRVGQPSVRVKPASNG